MIISEKLQEYLINKLFEELNILAEGCELTEKQNLDIRNELEAKTKLALEWRERALAVDAAMNEMKIQNKELEKELLAATIKKMKG